MNKTLSAVALAVSIVAVFLAGRIASRPVTALPAQVVQVERQGESFGALSTEVASPFLTWGGVASYKARQTIRPATTTLCALKSPAATSTLDFAVMKIDGSTTTASVVYIAKATTAFATTTQLAMNVLSANEQITLTASSSILNAVVTDEDSNPRTLAPNTWINFSMKPNISGEGAGLYPLLAPVGVCEAGWTAVR